MEPFALLLPQERELYVVVVVTARLIGRRR
jgi:hypothetical protein